MTTIIPFTVLNLNEEGIHLLIKVFINNKAARLIVDTGASQSVFDKGRIEKYVNHKDFGEHHSLSSGLGTNTMQSHYTKIKKLKIGDLEIKNYEAILIDLSHVNDSYHSIGLSKLDGVLGGDILMKYHAVINYRKAELKLNFKKSKK